MKFADNTSSAPTTIERRNTALLLAGFGLLGFFGTQIVWLFASGADIGTILLWSFAVFTFKFGMVFVPLMLIGISPFLIVRLSKTWIRLHRLKFLGSIFYLALGSLLFFVAALPIAKRIFENWDG